MINTGTRELGLEERGTMPETKNKKVSSFKDLKIWQKAITLTEQVYKSTKAFPEDEKYGLSMQLRRASVSIASNISEGFGRYYTKDYQRFLFIAVGSCNEVYTQITIASRLNYLNDLTSDQLLKNCDEISKMIRGLIKKLNE